MPAIEVEFMPSGTYPRDVTSPGPDQRPGAASAQQGGGIQQQPGPRSPEPGDSPSQRPADSSDKPRTDS